MTERDNNFHSLITLAKLTEGSKKTHKYSKCIQKEIIPLKNKTKTELKK